MLHRQSTIINVANNDVAYYKIYFIVGNFVSNTFFERQIFKLICQLVLK